MFTPFFEYGFMQRALWSCIAISIANAPIGVLLMLRRNSLMGEALSHGILPGIAIAYLIGGVNLPIMCLGGVIAGLIVAWLSNIITQKTILYEDASFTVMYVLFLALGIMILSIAKGNMNILHLLFGGVLAIDNNTLKWIIVISSISLAVFLYNYRTLILVSFDPVFARSLKINTNFYSLLFFTIVVCNLVAAYQAMGTLITLGLMMIPAVTARLISNRLSIIFCLSLILGILGSIAGLLISFHHNLPTGPTIVLVFGAIYLLTLFFSIYQKTYKLKN
jgi:zinc/manganese transport system permease protein